MGHSSSHIEVHLKTTPPVGVVSIHQMQMTPSINQSIVDDEVYICQYVSLHGNVHSDVEPFSILLSLDQFR